MSREGKPTDRRALAGPAVGLALLLFAQAAGGCSSTAPWPPEKYGYHLPASPRVTRCHLLADRLAMAGTARSAGGAPYAPLGTDKPVRVVAGIPLALLDAGTAEWSAEETRRRIYADLMDTCLSTHCAVDLGGSGSCMFHNGTTRRVDYCARVRLDVGSGARAAGSVVCARDIPPTETREVPFTLDLPHRCDRAGHSCTGSFEPVLAPRLPPREASAE
jgi:hypothetical protein